MTKAIEKQKHIIKIAAVVLLVILVGLWVLWTALETSEPASTQIWDFTTRTCDFLEVLDSIVAKCTDGSEWLVTNINPTE